jgi:spore coat protein A, manganese oxidase
MDADRRRRTAGCTMAGRGLLKRAVVGVGVLMIWAGTGAVIAPGTMPLGDPAVAAPFATVPRFTVPMPIPPKATSVRKAPARQKTFHLTQRQTEQIIHPSLGPTTVWGFDDGTLGPSYPGPTIEVTSEEAITVAYENQLPTTHLLSSTETVRTLTHLHGGFSLGVDDGNPYATIDPYELGEVQAVRYQNEQPATMLWYHDHASEVTRLNVYAGLAGLYLIRDSNDTGLEPNPIGIPGGAYEIPIVIQDRTFDEDGQLFYRQFGDTAVVNGAAFPFLDVEPRQYRFRFLNGSNARFYNLEIGEGPSFQQIGSDGGMFDAPVPRERILIGPADRADVIVDFGAFRGETLVLRNLQGPAGLPEIMQFQVGHTVTSPGPTGIPTSLPGSVPSFDRPDRERYVTLELVGGSFVFDGLHFHDPVNIRVPAGDLEDWLLIGLAVATHPIHVHPPEFQVVSRRPFDVAAYRAALEEARAAGNPNPDPAPFYTGGALPLQANDYGFKDVVSVPTGQVVRVRMPFDVPSGVPRGVAKGAPQGAPKGVPEGVPRGVPRVEKYVFHCHILEHEDNDMMRPLEVVTDPRGGIGPRA